jgi:hypothetical protein
VRWRIAIGCDLSASGLRAVANLQGSDARESTCSKAVTDAPDHSSNLGSQAACEAFLYLTLGESGTLASKKMIDVTKIIDIDHHQL